MPQVAPTDAEAATGTKSAQPSAIEDDTDEAVSQAILKQSEMSEQMQAAAIEVAAKAVAKGGWDNEIAARIKKEMDKIIKMKLPFTEEIVTREEAQRRINEQGEPYKLEILNRIKSEKITIW